MMYRSLIWAFFIAVACASTNAEAASPNGIHRDGAFLYETHCSSCHGSDLQGTRGAPSLKEAGGARVDFYMTTGRMPLAVKASDTDPHASLDAVMASGVQAPHQPSMFSTSDIAAIDAYVDAHAVQSIIVSTPDTVHASMQHGRSLFEENCEACHGVGAQGATVGYQWIAPALNQANPLQIAQAIRIGPGVMPKFTSAQLSENDIADIAAYLGYLRTQPQTFGGMTLGFLGPTAEGAVAILLGIGTLIVLIRRIAQ